MCFFQELTRRWFFPQNNLTKDIYALTEVEYLLLTNMIEEVISIVMEELYASSIEQNNVDDNENDETDSYIKFGLTAIW